MEQTTVGQTDGLQHCLVPSYHWQGHNNSAWSAA